MLLTHLLIPLLDATSKLPRNASKPGSVRIVVQASMQHKFSPSDIKFEDLDEVQQDIGGNNKYVAGTFILLRESSADMSYGMIATQGQN